MKDLLDKELDKRKIFVIRYAFLITAVLVLLTLGLLNSLKIGDSSILTIIIKYYFR